MAKKLSCRRLSLGRTRSLEAAGLVAAGLVAVAFLVWGAHMGRAGEPAGSALWPARDGSIVVWRSAGGALAVRMTDAAGAATDSSLGAGSDARLIAGGERPVILVTAPGGGHRLVRNVPAVHTWSTIAAALAPADLTTAAMAGGLAYLPVGRGSQASVIAVRADGRTAARIPLPILEPDPSAFMALPGAGAGTGKASRGHVVCLLVVGDDVLAITSTPAAAAVTDLQTRARVSLAGFTKIFGATVGGDGIVYILAGRADPAFSLRFLRVDPHSMRVLSAWDTGVAATDEPVWALPTRFGAVFYSPGAPGALDAWSGTNVWLVDGSGARENSTVSPNVGERMGPGRKDSVLFYDRPDGVVTRLDTDDGALSRASARLSAPSGATIVLAAD
jgi:hypothetical protein